MARRKISEQDKQTRVKRELERLETIFECIADINKKEFVKRQIEELAWLVVSASDLQHEIDKKGHVVEFQNGRNQRGLQQNPGVKILNDYMKQINTITRTLLPVVPEKKTGSELDDFFTNDFNPEEWERKEMEEEERHKKIQADIDRAIEQQRREREQREKERIS